MSGKDTARYLICYDITSSSKRQRVANMLLNYGDRLQMSVFEAQLSEDDVKDILKRAEKYVDKEDSFRIYSICANCLAKVWTLGREFKVDSTGARII